MPTAATRLVEYLDAHGFPAETYPGESAILIADTWKLRVSALAPEHMLTGAQWHHGETQGAILAHDGCPHYVVLDWGVYQDMLTLTLRAREETT